MCGNKRSYILKETFRQSSKSTKVKFFLTLFRMGDKKAPYPFFPCNFYKRRNYPQKLSDF